MSCGTFSFSRKVLIKTSSSLEKTPSAPITLNKSSIKETRQILSDPRIGFVETKVFDRSNLIIGQEFLGPAVVDQIDTTTWVPQGWSASVLEGSMLFLERVGN